MVNLNTNTSIYKNNLSFKAIPLAKYEYLKDKTDGITIYQLEKKDINWIKNNLNNIDKFYKKYNIENESAKQVIKEAFGASIEILQGKKSPEQKAKILVSFYNNNPSSILVGNTLKVDKKGKLHYSSRKYHKKKETELDWLASWNKLIPGEGQATVYEYFHSLIKDGFKKCFVRAELPEKSSAVNFYKKMGFKPISKTPRKMLSKNDNQYLIGEFDDLDDKIIPMKISLSGIIRIINQKADKMQRREIRNKQSVNLLNEKF